MPRQLSVGAPNRQVYAPPVNDYRKKLGQKEVHAPANKLLRKKLRDRPAHKVSADAQSAAYISNGALAVACAVVISVGLALVSAYGLPQVNNWIPNSETATASTYLWFVFGLSLVTGGALVCAFGVVALLTHCFAPKHVKA